MDARFRVHEGKVAGAGREGGRAPFCHSERSAIARSRRIPQADGHSESVGASRLAHMAALWILRCAQNDIWGAETTGDDW